MVLRHGPLNVGTNVVFRIDAAPPGTAGCVLLIDNRAWRKPTTARIEIEYSYDHGATWGEEHAYCPVDYATRDPAYGPERVHVGFGIRTTLKQYDVDHAAATLPVGEWGKVYPTNARALVHLTHPVPEADFEFGWVSVWPTNGSSKTAQLARQQLTSRSPA